MERVRELSEDVRDIVSSIVLFPGVFGDKKRSGTWGVLLSLWIECLCGSVKVRGKTVFFINFREKRKAKRKAKRIRF